MAWAYPEETEPKRSQFWSFWNQYKNKAFLKIMQTSDIIIKLSVKTFWWANKF